MSDDASSAPLRFPDIPKLELDELIDQLVDRAQGVRRAQGRLRSLLRAIQAISGDLSLETVLRKIAEAACELAHARYAALGVIGHDGSLERFVHVGMDAEAAERIGILPQGKGLLGALITDPRPIRLVHMHEDERSTGFPPNHPAMDSFLGVPIPVRGQVYGNLYLTDSANGEFSAEDEELVIALASAAGTAISNARLYQESRAQQRWLEASVEIGSQMLASAGEDPLHMIARRAAEIADADLVSVGLTDRDSETIVVEVAYGYLADELPGRRYRLAETVSGRVTAENRPLLLLDINDADGLITNMSAVIDPGPLMVLPLRGTGAPRGTLSIARRRGREAFTATDLAMAAGFATHASLALELADSRAAEQKLMVLEDRDRIAMDLHDHVIQELFAIGLNLEAVAGQLADRSPLSDRVRHSVEEIDRTIRRIRTSIFELRGNRVVSTGGLRQRILEVASELTAVLGVAPHVAFAGLVDLDLDDELIGDVLAVVREALTNVAKHAHATDVSVDVVLAKDELTVTVSDNGVGAQGATRSSGTSNLRVRSQRHGGTFEMEPGPTGGTILRWRARVS